MDVTRRLPRAAHVLLGVQYATRVAASLTLASLVSAEHLDASVSAGLQLDVKGALRAIEADLLALHAAEIRGGSSPEDRLVGGTGWVRRLAPGLQLVVWAPPGLRFRLRLRGAGGVAGRPRRRGPSGVVYEDVQEAEDVLMWLPPLMGDGDSPQPTPSMGMPWIPPVTEPGALPLQWTPTMTTTTTVTTAMGWSRCAPHWRL